MTALLKPLEHYLKAHACVVTPPSDIYQLQRACPSRVLERRNLIQLRDRLPPAIRYPMHGTRHVYYAVRLAGSASDHPHPETIETLQGELARVFESHGFAAAPLSCHSHWRADQWERDEAFRFDEVLGHHAQEPRLASQKYARTQGDLTLVYQIPVARIDDLARVMAAVEQLRQKAQIHAR